MTPSPASGEMSPAACHYMSYQGMGVSHVIGTTQLFPLNILPRSGPWRGNYLVNLQRAPFCKTSFPSATSIGLLVEVVKAAWPAVYLTQRPSYTTLA